MVEINRRDEEGTDEVVPDFHLSHLGSVENMSIQYFRFDPGSVVEAHSHHQEQIGFVYRGELNLTVEDKEYVVGPGDVYLLESNETHGGQNRGEEPVEGVDIFSPPRAAPNWTD